jgi:hypothetical protein
MHADGVIVLHNTEELETVRLHGEADILLCLAITR